MRYRGDFYCPVCGSHVRKFLDAGIVPRANARCPVCSSLERHRMVWLYLNEKSDLFSGIRKKLLHIAPEACLKERLKSIKNIDYVTVDLKNDHMVKMDVTRSCFRDGAFDVIYCSHVLEHVEDDIAGMREMLRVLKKDGFAIIQVPVSGNETSHDPNVTDPKDRFRLYGQEDHVRSYGRDYAKRLTKAGFRVKVIPFVETYSTQERNRYGLMEGDDIYLCTV